MRLPLDTYTTLLKLEISTAKVKYFIKINVHWLELKWRLVEGYGDNV